MYLLKEMKVGDVELHTASSFSDYTSVPSHNNYWSEFKTNSPSVLRVALPGSKPMPLLFLITWEICKQEAVFRRGG